MTSSPSAQTLSPLRRPSSHSTGYSLLGAPSVLLLNDLYEEYQYIPMGSISPHKRKEAIRLVNDTLERPWRDAGRTIHYHELQRRADPNVPGSYQFRLNDKTRLRLSSAIILASRIYHLACKYDADPFVTPGKRFTYPSEPSTEAFHEYGIRPLDFLPDPNTSPEDGVDRLNSWNNSRTAALHYGQMTANNLVKAEVWCAEAYEVTKYFFDWSWLFRDTRGVDINDLYIDNGLITELGVIPIQDHVGMPFISFDTYICVLIPFGCLDCFASKVYTDASQNSVGGTTPFYSFGDPSFSDEYSSSCCYSCGGLHIIPPKSTFPLCRCPSCRPHETYEYYTPTFVAGLRAHIRSLSYLNRSIHDDFKSPRDDIDFRKGLPSLSDFAEDERAFYFGICKSENDSVLRKELERTWIKGADDLRFPLGINTDFAHLTIEDVLRTDMLDSPDSSSSSSLGSYSISSSDESASEADTHIRADLPLFEMDDY
jgi:hypothetical protein